MKMPRANDLLLLAISVLVLYAWPATCTYTYYPVIFPVAKDAASSLYTIPVRDGDNHVIDLAGPLLWSTCAGDHLPASYKCQDRECKLANAYRPPGCRAAGQACRKQCKAYPYNPITGQCAAASLIHTRLIANTTDGKNTVTQASIRAVGACAPSKLLARLPAGVTGVAGLAGSGLALPAQIAASQHVANKFLLCLPKRGEGVAVFGGGPFFLPETPQTDVTSTLAYTPLHSRKGSPMYYLAVKGVDVNQTAVPFPAYALDAGGVVLCTRVPYTLLRPDVYRPFVNAFDKAMGRWNKDAKVPGVAPFELCYRSSMLPNTRVGYGVPDVRIRLEGGKDWTFLGSNSMVDVNDKTACLAFAEMKGAKPGDGKVPSMVIGGFQMENTVMQFDLEKQRLGFAKLPFFTACSNFNFTNKSY
ncbi:hypothetical protein PR202_gb03812 [Eleusine coracana subsp. coracana]|uniref:Peptidase A1 domain-containing protein n=1 Tax=Eleusine coracana subsp. coracana TaxID=191504 RepID=A0AAV5E2N0_ELECO|nr:hypothetical protein PR202_gb03812 [Eleusine coracana subsp. coracana]